MIRFVFSISSLTVFIIAFSIFLLGGFKYEAQHDLTRHETPRGCLEAQALSGPMVQSVLDHSQLLICDGFHWHSPKSLDIFITQFDASARTHRGSAVRDACGVELDCRNPRCNRRFLTWPQPEFGKSAS